MQINLGIVCSLWALWRSLNSRSTTTSGWSWVYPPLPPPPPSSNIPQAMNLHPTVCLSPLLRDVDMMTSIHSKNPSLPLPSPEGCGWFITAQWRIWGMRNTMGDAGSGMPRWCITETGHDICHGPFSLIFPTSNKLTQPVSLKWQVTTKKKTVTTTTVETATMGMTTKMTQQPPQQLQWGWQPQWPYQHHDHTQCQQYSPTMSSTQWQPDDDQWV